MIVVVCNVTGTQGCAIVDRFQELNKRTGNATIVRGLTRNQHSEKALTLVKGKDHVELYSVDYNSTESFQDAFDGADALFLNVIMSRNESDQYKAILQAAVKTKSIRHVIFSSSAECHRNHGVPHWETSWHTEEYLTELQKRSDNNISKLHILRYAHCNENMQSFYKPSKDGWMAFPWDPSVRVHTASVTDGARVACQLFLDPSRLPNADVMDITTDFCSPNEMAQAMSRARGGEITIQAYKGPWIFLNLIRWLAYEPNSIVTMGKFIESNWNQEFVPKADKIEEFLKDEIENGEPLETVQAFCERVERLR